MAALATFSAEQRIQAAAFEVGCSLNKLADYVGISKSVLAERLANGSLSVDAAKKIEETLQVMKVMRLEAGLPVDWTFVPFIKPLLERKLVEYKEQKDPVETRCWYIRLSHFNFLKSVNSYGPIETINYQVDGAAFSDHALAQKAADKLKAIKIASTVELLTGPRRKSTITTSLEELGFEPSSVAAVEVKA